MTGMPPQANFLTSTVPIAQLSAAPAISRAPTGAAPTAPRSWPISSTSAAMPSISARTWRSVSRAPSTSTLSGDAQSGMV